MPKNIEQESRSLSKDKKPNYMKRRAGALAAATVVAIGGGKAITEHFNGTPANADATAQKQPEQTGHHYTIHYGETMEGVSRDDLEERVAEAHQPFAEEPTESDVLVHQREIIGETNMDGSNPTIEDPDKVQAGQEITIPNKTEVPIRVRPEVVQTGHEIPPVPTVKPQN